MFLNGGKKIEMDEVIAMYNIGEFISERKKFRCDDTTKLFIGFYVLEFLLSNYELE